MATESSKWYPNPSKAELLSVHIKTTLEQAGFEVLKLDGRSKDSWTVTTDKDVPEEIKSNIREYAGSFISIGVSVNFVTPPE